MDVVHLLIAIWHFWGQPENFMVLGEFDHELACQDAREDYVRVVAEGRRKGGSDRHERAICTGEAPPGNACVRLGRYPYHRGAEAEPAYQDAYSGCRWLLGFVK